ncbi:hypothetical protein BH09SUM1_BH09SUM1_04070 [soil metagenome]
MAELKKNDHRTQRYRRRRLRKKLIGVGAPLFGLVLCLVLGAAVALSSERFWERFIFPRFFGPYWQTVLKWDKFQPQVFPPGVTFTNLQMREPGQGGSPVISAEKFQLLLSYSSRPSSIDITNAEVKGLTVNYAYYGADGLSNLTRALERLFAGMPPAGRERARSKGEKIIPRIMLRNAAIDGLSVRYEDSRYAGAIATMRYISDGPVTVVADETTRLPSPGRADNYLQFRTKGQLVGKINDWDFHGRMSLELAADSLRDFPRSDMSGSAEIIPMGEDFPRLRFSATMPTERLAVRPVATPFKNVKIEWLDGAAAAPLFIVENASLDPLTGDLALEGRGRGTAKQLASAVQAYLTPDDAARFAEDAAANRIYAYLHQGGHDLPLDAEVKITGHGVGQYAIVDEHEEIPMELHTEGSVRVGGAPISALSEFQDAITRQFPDRITTNTLQSDLVYKWKFSAFEKDQLGELWMKFLAAPEGLDPNGVAMSVTLSDSSDEDTPLTFNPFRPDLRRDVATALEDTSATIPAYRVFSSYESTLSSISQQLSSGFAILDALELKDATLRERLAINDPRVMKAVIEPILGTAEQAKSGQFSIAVTRVGKDLPSLWEATAHVDGVKLKDVAGEISLQGNIDLVRENSRMYAHDLRFEMARQDQGTTNPVVLSLGLARVTRTGGAGPTRPTFIDLNTGEAHFELRADTINREIMEIILRVQTFNLSQQLAKPLYQRILDLVGLRPGDPTARGEASVHVTGDVGETLTIGTLLQMKNIPAANFFDREGMRSENGEKFDAYLSQEMELDRRSALLRPREFSLRLTPPGEDAEFALIRFVPDGQAAFDYVALQNLAMLETEQLSDTPPGRQTIRSFAAGFFDRLQRLRETLTLGRGKVIMALPHLKLGSFQQSLHDVGLPVTDGELHVHVETELARREGEVDATAAGTFLLSGLRLRGVAETLPDMAGDVDFQHKGNAILLRDLSTTAAFDPALPPTRIQFGGALFTDSLDSSWTLGLHQINGRVMEALQSIRTAGIGGAAAIAANLPLNGLAQIAGKDGSLDMTFNAFTEGATDSAQLHAFQQGRNLIVLPSFFHPLSFDLDQRLVYTADGMTLNGLSGKLEEAGTLSPLAKLSLDQPVHFGASVIDGRRMNSATLKLTAEKNLAEIATRLHDFPLPLFRRPVTSGNVRGDVEIVFPQGSVDLASTTTLIQNRFALAASDVRLEGFPHRIDGSINAEVEKQAENVTLRGGRIEALVDGQSSGRIDVDGSYQLADQTIHFQIDLVDLHTLLLQALPDQFAPWMEQPTSTLNARAVIDGNVVARKGILSLVARARDFGLPPLPLPDGTSFTHPPLHLDFGVTSSFDAQTSSVLVENLDFTVAKGGTINREDRLALLPPNVEPLLTVNQTFPLSIDLGAMEFAPDSEEGAGLHALLGPINLQEYGAVLYQLTGVPLTTGLLEGEADVVAVGKGATRVNRVTLDVKLADAIWQHSTGLSEPMSGVFRLSAGSFHNVLRLDDMTVRMEYPNSPAPVDHLSVRGYYEYDRDDNRTEAEMDMRSDGVSVDRVLSYVNDYQLNSRSTQEVEKKSAKPQAKIPSESILPKTKDLTARLTGEFANLSFRELKFPETTMHAQFADKKLQVTELRSRLTGGEINMSGDVDLKSLEASPWNIFGRIENLDATPWVNSFADVSMKDKVKGLLSARFSMKGPGFTDTDRRNVEGSADVKLRGGQIDQRSLRMIAGGDDIGADAAIIVRGNRMLFKLTTPYDETRDLLLQGTLRNVYPDDNSAPYVQAFADFRRTTAVGPRGNSMIFKGQSVPFRQDLFGVDVEITGPVTDSKQAEYDVRTLHY